MSYRYTFESGKSIELSIDEETDTLLIKPVGKGEGLHYTARQSNSVTQGVLVSTEPISFELMGKDWLNDLHEKGRVGI